MRIFAAADGQGGLASCARIIRTGHDRRDGNDQVELLCGSPPTNDLAALSLTQTQAWEHPGTWQAAQTC